MRPPIFSRTPEQATPERASTIDFSLAAEALLREHEVLASLQGADSDRVDGLVKDVGEIKGSMQSLQGDVGRVAVSVESLAKSMVEMNRHTFLLEKHAVENDRLRASDENHEHRLQALERAVPEKLSERLQDAEKAIPPLVETRKWAIAGGLGVLGAVGLALLGTVLSRGSP